MLTIHTDTKGLKYADPFYYRPPIPLAEVKNRIERRAVSRNFTHYSCLAEMANSK